MSRPKKRQSPSFFSREPDGTVRIRLRFDQEEASLYEEAAGTMPVVDWLHHTLVTAARAQVAKARETQPKVVPKESA